MFIFIYTKLFYNIERDVEKCCMFPNTNPPLMGVGWGGDRPPNWNCCPLHIKLSFQMPHLSVTFRIKGELAADGPARLKTWTVLQYIFYNVNHYYLLRILVPSSKP